MWPTDAPMRAAGTRRGAQTTLAYGIKKLQNELNACGSGGHEGNTCNPGASRTFHV